MGSVARQDMDHILFACYNMIVSCSLVSTVYVMICHVYVFFSVCIIKPKVYHTTRNDPQICPESAFFHNNLSTSSGAAAGHVPLARLLRLTPEDRTFPVPVKAGRVGHECDMSRPPDLFGSKKKVIHGDVQG